MHRDSIAFLANPPEEHMAGDGAPTLQQLEERRIFVETFTDAMRRLIDGSQNKYLDEIIWAGNLSAGLVGYFMATGHDHYCMDCLTERAQMLVNAASAGFQHGLDATQNSGGRKADGSLAGH